MKNTKENRDRIKIGSVVQLTFQDDRGFRGCMMTVAYIRTWGVEGWVAAPGGNPAVYGAPWSHFELTGGMAAFDEKGGRMRETEAPLKHHP